MKKFLPGSPKLLFLSAGLLIITVIYLLYNAGQLENENPVRAKKIELKETTLRGYKNGRLFWSMQSKYVWSNLNIDHAVVEDIYNGKLYEADRLLLDKLSARKVQVNAPQERFYADKGFWAVLYRQNKKNQPVEIWGEQLNYNGTTQKSQLQKEVQVLDRQTRLNARQAEIDHQINRISFGQDAVLVRPDLSLTAEAISIDLDQDIFTAHGKVQLVRQAENSADELRRQKTNIQADALQADIAREKALIILTGNILLKQADKQALSDTLLYNENDNLCNLSGNALVIFDRSDWLLDNNTRQKLSDKTAEFLQKKIQLQGERIVINTETKDLQAAGKVRVTLLDKTAAAEKAVYDRAAEKIYLTEQAALTQADGSTVQAARIIIDIPTEKFTADGQAESTLYLQL